MEGSHIINWRGREKFEFVYKWIGLWKQVKNGWELHCRYIQSRLKTQYKEKTFLLDRAVSSALGQPLGGERHNPKLGIYPYPWRAVNPWPSGQGLEVKWSEVKRARMKASGWTYGNGRTWRMKIFISCVNEKAQSVDDMHWPVDINPLNGQHWSINSVQGGGGGGCAWFYQHELLLSRRISLFPPLTIQAHFPTGIILSSIPAFWGSTGCWNPERVNFYRGTQKMSHWPMGYGFPQSTLNIWCPGNNKQEEESLSWQITDSNQQRVLGLLLCDGDMEENMWNPSHPLGHPWYSLVLF